MLKPRHPSVTFAHTSPDLTRQSTEFDKPTVQQLKLAFQQTPLKLRQIEDGWRGKRRQLVDELKANSPRLRKSSSALRTGLGTGEEQIPTQAAHVQGYLPSPPPTPREPRSSAPQLLDAPRSSEGALGRDDKAADIPQPILAFPLTGTTTPIAIAPGVKMRVPPSDSRRSYELRLTLGAQHVVVANGGRSLTWTAGSGDSRRIRLVDLDSETSWSDATRKQWEMVAELVERVKRRTPRVKILHPLGLVTVTCSRYPDVQLAFDIRLTSTSSSKASHDKASHDKASHDEALQRMRIVYSPSTRCIQIRTCLTREGEARASFRTRRTVPLFAKLDRTVHDRSRTDTARAACRALGLILTDDWLDCEVTALERFWSTRDEWGRYIDKVE